MCKQPNGLVSSFVLDRNFRASKQPVFSSTKPKLPKENMTFREIEYKSPEWVEAVRLREKYFNRKVKK